MALSPEDRLIKARVALIKDKPFYGRLAMRLHLCQSNQVPTTATDGEYLYYSPEFIEKITENDIEFCVEHEIMHIVQNAFDRRPLGADPMRWNLACDYVIDTLIKDSGCTAPILDEYRGKTIYDMARDKTSEQIYKLLQENQPKCPGCEAGTPPPQHKHGDENGQCGHGNDPGDDPGQGGGTTPGQGDGKDSPGQGGNGMPAHTCNPKGCVTGPMSKKMTEQQKSQWKQAIVGAAEYARGKGKLPGYLSDMIGKLLEPTVNWKEIVRYSAAKAFRGRYTWTRPSRRQGKGFPLRRIARDPNPKGAVIMLDTSGSISDKELIQFVSESVEILRVCKAPWVDIMLHDTDCYKVWRITKTSAEDKWEVRRGGTSHVDVFKKCLEANDKPGLIVAFTDLATDFPPDMPPCEVIWAHPKGYGENATIPWGIKVLVDMEDN